MKNEEVLGRVESIVSRTPGVSGAVYFGSVGVIRSRHAIPAGLFADAVGAISAVFFCKLLIA